MIWQRYDVFVSYSRLDSPKTDLFVKRLQERGYRVFYDKETLLLGERWKERLNAGIRSSRACILCWSEHARASEIVAYEYSLAGALNKKVLPWLLDGTPLPQMIEIQGINEHDPLAAVSCFLPRLGWRAGLRRRAQIAALSVVMLACCFLYLWLRRPPPPWQFGGRITDSETKLPIPNVEVDAERHRFVTYTDTDGRYVLRLPQPRPKYLHLMFAKTGYRGEEEFTVPPDHPFDLDMTKLPASRGQP